MLPLFVSLVAVFAAFVLASTVPGYDSLRIQAELAKRENSVDMIYNYLSDPEADFINVHLANLTNTNGTRCDQCKHRMRYGRFLIDEHPDQSHLVSLLLFKYCLVVNNNTQSRCNQNDFFVSSDFENFEKFDNEFDSGISRAGSLNFYDNDFLRVLKNFNVSSELDLEYYCFYKDRRACALPETPDVEELFGVSQWWPEKQPHHYAEPNYTNNSETFNVLHFSDIHLQPRYYVGTEANCTTTPCGIPESYNAQLPSRDYNFTDYYRSFNPDLADFELSFYPDAHYDENNTYVKGEYYDYPKYRGWNFRNAPATSFGAYLADSPELLMNNSLLNMARVHDDVTFDFGIFNGDAIDHLLLRRTPEYARSVAFKLFGAIGKVFGSLPILSVLGNHEINFNYGQLIPQRFNNDQGYNGAIDQLADLWVEQGWFGEEDRQGLKTNYCGFSYVTDRGLKVIGLNSNAWYQKNLWTYIDQTAEPDLFGQWQFLVNELVESEANGQRVWIVTHIPVLDYDALPIQSRIFGKIVERFSPYTIANIFVGHTHKDRFHILYSPGSAQEAEDAINMAWNVQSVSPLTRLNPGWRYYEVENESFNIINAYNYYTMLNETFVNGGAEPVWRFEYSARDYYDTEHTWPARAPLNATFWHNYVVNPLRNQSNIEFNQRFTNFQYRFGPSVANCTNGTVVSNQCYNENYCIVTSFFSDDLQNCLRG
ncbi:putative sphingomyelin phosphodiesterase asm-3 [Candida viswanathii]|uniref:Putative sphingomyelin phosphodiesterase asm-3 n=1 Tax=Candida viswanathii TaxID=5486 RepID=A0A367Y542_9ASCO|nr:putative sphingomyelin phosphodiesterase asm-3 [Candida viswanathii]